MGAWGSSFRAASHIAEGDGLYVAVSGCNLAVFRGYTRPIDEGIFGPKGIKIKGLIKERCENNKIDAVCKYKAYVRRYISGVRVLATRDGCLPIPLLCIARPHDDTQILWNEKYFLFYATDVAPACKIEDMGYLWQQKPVALIDGIEYTIKILSADVQSEIIPTYYRVNTIDHPESAWPDNTGAILKEF